MNTLSERLKYLIEKSMITVPELAKTIGVNKGTIYNILNDKTEPKKDTLSNIAKVLNTTTDYLIHGKHEYKDLLEKQLLESFRTLDRNSKIDVIAEVVRLKTKQELKDKQNDEIELE